MSDIRALDLFAGCGGLSNGFIDASINVVIANEFWDPAIKTYNHNHLNTEMIEGDITSEKIKEQIVKLAKKEGINLIIGGPPCQAFSTSGYRNCLDKRFDLFKEYLEMVKKINPEIIVMENVKGILTSRSIRNDLTAGERKRASTIMMEIFRYKQLNRYKAQRDLSPEELNEWTKTRSNFTKNKKELNAFQGPILTEILTRFKELGYHVYYKILNASDFEIPQHRERVFFIGFKKKPALEVFPEGTYKKIGCKEKLKDLENAKENEIPNHVFTKHKPEFIERLKKVKPGESLTSYNEGFFKLKPDEPSPTVKENHGSVFIHYEKYRCVTPRELARLQSFDDTFEFKGTKGEILKEIGNSVPPKLSFEIATHIKQFF